MIKTTYRNDPYFYPSKGDVISQEQLERMCSYEEGWEVVGRKDSSIVKVDFADMDGLRNDWFCNGKEFYRLKMVKTFTGTQELYVVTETSY